MSSAGVPIRVILEQRFNALQGELEQLASSASFLDGQTFQHAKFAAIAMKLSMQMESMMTDPEAREKSCRSARSLINTAMNLAARAAGRRHGAILTEMFIILNLVWGFDWMAGYVDLVVAGLRTSLGAFSQNEAYLGATPGPRWWQLLTRFKIRNARYESARHRQEIVGLLEAFPKMVVALLQKKAEYPDSQNSFATALAQSVESAADTLSRVWSLANLSWFLGHLSESESHRVFAGWQELFQTVRQHSDVSPSGGTPGARLHGIVPAYVRCIDGYAEKLADGDPRREIARAYKSKAEGLLN